MNHFIKTVTNSVKHWYIPLIVGLIFLGVGIYTLVTPLASYLALSIVFSLSFLISGISEITFSISNRNEIDNWGWTLIFGILTFVLGILLLMNPEISIETLPLYIGFLVLFKSIAGISFAIELKNYGVKSWANLLILSIIGLILAFILIWNPILAGMTIVFWTGITIISGGIFGIYLSLKLKKINDIPSKISKELKDRYQSIKKELKEEVHKHS